MQLKNKIEELKQKSIEEINTLKDLKALEDIRIKYLGKKGELTAFLRGMKDLSQEQRPIIGGLVNDAKESIEKIIQKKEEEFKAQELNRKLENEKIDITLPGSKLKRGSMHPLNRVIEDMEDLFVSMGYEVVTGPELETDEFCFKRLNVPERSPCKRYARQFLYYR